jgi:hypothetical protein
MPKATDLFGPDLPYLGDAVAAIPGQPEASIFELFTDGTYKPPAPVPPAGKMSNKQQYARHLAQFLPVGSTHAIEASALARSLGLPWERTQKPLRGLIRHFVVVQRWPIVTHTSGTTTRFYLVDNDVEAAAYLDQLQFRMDSIRDQQIAIEAGWNKRKASLQQGLNWPKRG